MAGFQVRERIARRRGEVWNAIVDFKRAPTYALAEIGEETEVELRAECRARGAWKLIGPIIGVLMRRADSSQLSLLKRLLEARD